jgi:hypothetical protein
VVRATKESPIDDDDRVLMPGLVPAARTGRAMGADGFVAV